MPLGVAKQKSGGACPITYRYIWSGQEMLDEAHKSLKKVARRMQKYTNKGRRPLEF